MRTELACLILHPAFEQLTTKLEIDGKWVEYPDLCYRCHPDEYVEKARELEERYQATLRGLGND